VHVNPYTGRLLIPVSGSDTIELQIGENRADAERVASALDSAAHQNLDAVDRTLPPEVNDFESQRSPQTKRLIVYTAIAVAAGLGAYVSTLASPWVGLMAFMIGLAPLGTVLGTQSHKTWA
jgi:hypothetical protein